MSASRRLAGPLTVALGLALGLVAVEAILQAGALVVWWRNRDVASAPAPPSGGEGSAIRPEGTRVVLCVGDSFTYGVGADPRTTSWPRQLEARLRESRGTAGDWSVRVAAWPGRSSATARSRLGDDLRRDRPDWVCLLIGANDRWSTTAPDAGEGIGPGQWEWRWRTPRLVALVGAAWRERTGRDAPAAAERATVPAKPTGVGPEGDVELARLFAEIDRLRGLAPLTWGDGGGAARDPQAAAAARSEVLALIGPVRERDDPALSAALVRALVDFQILRPALEEGRRAVERHGMSVELGRAMVASLMRFGEIDEADRISAAIVALAPDRPEPRRSRSQILLARGDRIGALREGVRAVARGDDAAWFESFVVQWSFETAELDSALAPDPGAEPVPPDVAERVRTIARRTEASEQVRDEIRKNLTQAIDMVRGFGARPILLTYPTEGQLRRVNEVLREVARERSVPLVDTEPAIAEARREHDRTELWVPDGHCTAVGYGVVADLVARRLPALAGPPPR